MKTKSLHSIFAILAAAAFLIPSCKVDDNFSAEKIAETDLTMTLFEDGLELPLLQNDTLRIDSLMNKIPEELKKYLKTDDNGYYILYGDTLKVEDLLAELSLDELVSLEGLDVKDTAEFTMGTFHPEDFAIDKTEIKQSIDLPDFNSAIDMTIPSINRTITEKAGIFGGEYNITLTLSGTHNVSEQILDKGTILEGAAAAEALSMTEFDLSEYFEAAMPVEMDEIEVDKTYLPENVTGVSDIVLKDGAAIKVTLSMSNCIFSHGSIIPDITVNLADVMTLEGYGNSVNISSLELNSGNSYTNTQTFNIETLNSAKLFEDKVISFTGNVLVTDTPKASTAIAKIVTDDMILNIDIEFINFEVADYTCYIDDLAIEPETALIDIDIDPVLLPDEVSAVNSITFTDASAIDFALEFINKEYLPDIELCLDEVSIIFPPTIAMHGEGVEGNVYTIPAGTSISDGITRTVYIDSIELDNSTPGKAGFAGKVQVDVKATVSGSFKGSQINSMPGDLEAKATVNGNLEVEDFDVVLNTIEKRVDFPGQSIDITGLDPVVGNFGTFVITPKKDGGKNPELEFEVSVPDLSAFPFDLGDGIVISLPDLVRLETPLDDALAYNEQKHTITISSLASHTYVLPIKELVVTPQKADDGTYFIHSTYGVEGGIKLEEAHIHKADIDAISGEKIEINATIPALEAQSVALEALQFAIPQIRYDLGDLVKAEDIPEMLIGINELDFGDLAIDIDVKTENLPDIGTGAFNVAVKAYLPDFINPRIIDINKDIVDGSISIHQDVSFDFSSYNFERMRAEGSAIGGEIRIEGTVSAQNPSVDISSISTDDPIRVMYNAKVGDSEGNIKLRSANAVVDYQIDTTLGVGLNFDFLSSEAFEIVTDFPELEFALDVKANTALPLDAKVLLQPFREGAPLGEPLKNVEIKIPYTADPAVPATETTSFGIDANRIFNEKADSLACNANLKVDRNKDCIIASDAEYNIEIDYSVRIPMYLGENTKIEYTDTLDISESGVSEYLSYAAFGLKAVVVNTLPLSLKLNAELLTSDESGELNTLALQNPISADIATGESTVEILVDPVNLADAADVTHILVKFTGVSDGGYISQGEGVILKQLSAVLPEGITIDPSDLKKRDNAE